MIVGSGDIASALKDKEGFTFFASGVSNSKETRPAEFWRETDLLLKQSSQGRLVYFGSLSIFTSDSPYAKHKKRMEEMVTAYFPRYVIIRLGNITWGTNPNTLINYLRTHPDAPIQDVYRSVISPEEFSYWMGLIPNWNCEMNIPGRTLKVKQIKAEYVDPVIYPSEV